MEAFASKISVGQKKGVLRGQGQVIKFISNFCLLKSTNTPCRLCLLAPPMNYFVGDPLMLSFPTRLDVDIWVPLFLGALAPRLETTPGRISKRNIFRQHFNITDALLIHVL